MDPVDRTPVNSLVSQSSERGIEGGELKQVSTEKEKQVIVNNYYINDRKEGWKQLEKARSRQIYSKARHIEIPARSHQKNHI